MIENHYLVDISNNIPLISIFNKFIKLHPEFYQQNINHKIIITENEDVCIIYKEPLEFTDTIHKVSGQIITDYEIITLPNSTKKENYIFNIWINKTNSDNYSLYHILIQDYINQQARHGDRVQLNYYKILNEQLITHTFYDSPVSEWINDVEILKNEFFSPHKKYLFDVMTQKNRNGNWSNLILYGEPGTGKSSFVFRLATQLKMSIISVDLSMYIDRKRDLYSIFHGNEFYLPYGKGQKLSVSQNCIIILEEFDSAIEKIYQLENIFRFKNDTIHNYVNNKTNEISQQVQNKLDQPDIPLSNPFQYIVDKQNAEKPNVDPLKITSEIFDIIRTITEDNKSDVLRLRDLLELFQGPIPVRDRLIVATTNNFEEIKGIIPPLFRPGRLTPIKFTYLDWSSLQELCFYYFGETLNDEPFKINIPTSQITELAIKYISMSSSLNDFLKELKSLNKLKYENQSKLIDLSKKQNAGLSNAGLSNAGLSNTGLSNAGLSNAGLQNAGLQNAGLSNAGLSNAELSNVGLSNAGLQNAGLSNAGLSNAGLSNNEYSIEQSSYRLNMYNDWIDKKLGNINNEENNNIKEKNNNEEKSNENININEDNQIRTITIDKVLDKDRQLMNKLPGYHADELLREYQQLAIFTPQHDDEY